MLSDLITMGVVQIVVLHVSVERVCYEGRMQPFSEEAKRGSVAT